eukprot:627906-Prymnesium_polylepis.2
MMADETEHVQNWEEPSRGRPPPAARTPSGLCMQDSNAAAHVRQRGRRAKRVHAPTLRTQRATTWCRSCMQK